MRKRFLVVRGVKKAGNNARRFLILGDVNEFLAELLWFCGPCFKKFRRKIKKAWSMGKKKGGIIFLF